MDILAKFSRIMPLVFVSMIGIVVFGESIRMNVAVGVLLIVATTLYTLCVEDGRQVND